MPWNFMSNCCCVCCRDLIQPPENPLPTTVFLSSSENPGLANTCDNLIGALNDVEPISLTHDGAGKWKSGRITVHGYCDGPTDFEFHWYCGFTAGLGPVSYVLEVFCGESGEPELTRIGGIHQPDDLVTVCDDTNPLLFRYDYQINPLDPETPEILCCCDTSQLHGIRHEITE